MNYLVKIDNVYANLLEIEADSPEEAREKAKDFFENNTDYVRKLKDHYQSTMPPEHWMVIMKEEFIAIKEDVDRKLKIKEDVALLIHRAALIDKRNKLKDKVSMAGKIENHFLKKNMLLADAEIDKRNIQLTDEHKEEIKKIMQETNPDMDLKTLELIDPKQRPYMLEHDPEFEAVEKGIPPQIEDGSFSKNMMLKMESFNNDVKVFKIKNKNKDKDVNVLEDKKSEQENAK